MIFERQYNEYAPSEPEIVKHKKIKKHPFCKMFGYEEEPFSIFIDF
jgi:hypothetical protein